MDWLGTIFFLTEEGDALDNKLSLSLTIDLAESTFCRDSFKKTVGFKLLTFFSS